MKKTLVLLMAITIMICIATAVGCGTVNETTRQTTSTTTYTTTHTTSTTVTERTTQTTQTTQTTETVTTDLTDTLIDPTFPLPDLNDPITDVEPNVPESNETGALEDILDDIGINDGNANDNMRNTRKRDLGSREKQHKKHGSSMTPSK